MMDPISAYIDFIRQYLVILILICLFIISLAGKPKVVIRIMYQIANLEEPLPKMKIVYFLLVFSSGISISFYYQYLKFTKNHDMMSKRENIERAYSYYFNFILFAFITLLICLIYLFCEKHLQLKGMRHEHKKKCLDLNINRHYKLD